MLTSAKPGPAPVQGDNRENLATVRMLRSILIIEALGVSGLVISDELTYHTLRTFYAAGPLIVLLIVCLLLLGRGIAYPAQILIPLGALLVRDYLAFEGVGIHDISILAFAAIVILAYLTLSKTWAVWFTGLAILSTSLISLGEINGILVNDYSRTTNLDDLVISAILLIAISAIMYLIIDRLNDSLLRARQNEQKQVETNAELEQERQQLEVRVAERTRDLERRAIQLRASAEVGSAAASIRDLDVLLNQAVRLVSLRFGFYHAGIFLLDDSGKFAVLRAANSEGGQKMLRRGHQLEVGRVGIVGHAAQSNQARIALDVGDDAVFFDNPDLPGTRSEMALPLRTGRVLGVLDVQSTEAGAFTQEDVETLQVVADQLAIAIENSRLFGESQAAIEATRRAYGEAGQQAWRQRLGLRAQLGFRATEHGGTQRVGTEGWTPEDKQAGTEGERVVTADGTTLSIPIAIRGQTVGILRLEKSGKAAWLENEMQVAQTLAGQLSDALESARLFDEAQRRADREKTIADVSTKIGSVFEVDDILRSMTEELGRLLKDSEVVVQLAKE